MSRTGEVYEAYRLALTIRAQAAEMDASAGVRAAAIAHTLTRSLPNMEPAAIGAPLLLFGQQMHESAQAAMRHPAAVMRAVPGGLPPDAARSLFFSGLMSLSIGATLVEMNGDNTWQA